MLKLKTALKKRNVLTNIIFSFSERVTSYNGSGLFSWRGPFAITMVQALDQNEGLGGYVFQAALNWEFSYVYLYMTSVSQNSTIDFIVNVFVENRPNNDFINGNLTENSVSLHT